MQNNNPKPILAITPSRVLSIIFALLNFLVTTTSTIHAQSVGLSISPPVIEILMKPNTSLIQAVTIKNQGETTNIVPEIVPIVPIDSFGHTSLDFTNSSIYSPLTISLENANYQLNQPFTLRSGDSAQLVLRLESASIVEPEDIYLALAISALSNQTGDSTIISTISSLILATITPTTNIPIDLEISAFPLAKIHDSINPLDITGTLTNNTPHMIRPVGTITITNLKEHTVYEQSIYPHLILKESSREIEGLYQENETSAAEPTPLSWKPSLLDIGPHQVTLTINSQSGDLITELSKTVWILPIQITIYLLVAIILLLTYKSYRSNHQSTNLSG